MSKAERNGFRAFGEQTKTASSVWQHGNSVHLEHLPKASSDIVEKRCLDGRFGILFGFTSGEVLHGCIAWRPD